MAQTIAARMLQELEAAHRDVAQCLAELEAITSNVSAEPFLYTTARFSLSKASAARRSCFKAICAEFGRTPSFQESIERARASDIRLMAQSRAHLAQWSPQAIAADWRGYCAASRRMRRAITEQIVTEEQLIIPLLKQRNEGSARAPAGRRAA